jgi:hypothetical protein
VSLSIFAVVVPQRTLLTRAFLFGFLKGGNLVEGNLFFNTCRESGDHGPINTWDRQPFLWDASGKQGYDTPPSVISGNFLVANYGASQGVDNDDGSSFYHILGNVNFGEGLKADYGGHDSTFKNNLVIVSPYDGQNCINVNHFKEGHQHTFADNTCVILACNHADCDDKVGYILDSCESVGFPLLSNNTYYTKNGNATLDCGGMTYTIDQLQRKFDRIEKGSAFHSLPDDDELVQLVYDRIAELEYERQIKAYSTTA